MIKTLPQQLKQYLLVTFNYWNFTITDGALRMLVVLYFYQLGYSAIAIAMLFLFYELFGVVTNLIGGWLGARIGLNHTMNIGLAMQIIALLALGLPSEYLSIPLVMAAQALSGIAKDLNKMSAKSSIKGLVKQDQQHSLYKWVAILTGSKNALKGFGFFLGGALLNSIGFQYSMLAMAAVLFIVLMLSLQLLAKDLGKAKSKPTFSQLFSKSRQINILAAARLFLFAARDVWFVVALPVYLSASLDWSHIQTGSFMAIWVIAYGVVQGFAPRITGSKTGKVPGRNSALSWAVLLSVVTGVLAYLVQLAWQPQTTIIVGLLVFGVVFAVNSSLHSYLVVSYASDDGVSMDVGFYYMANAMGRLLGTLLSGVVFQMAGIAACLWVSFTLLAITSLISIGLPKRAPKT
ncbi:organoarsenical effux MFS transporter ArsJ [Agarivorans sp. TSD2052]|uniref:organoarsenical effux MFS transporter ArsJ n=1 Tax=Agarivorans sp. TSD2052 TaxID=2937286 RepID=UPI00200C520D|nr:organoarsenical effux MFS transporter ArsJ [Agarivorans sp. TSD2052]UPW17621.1 organoarsenical effux MFS transporter ArsJ [Agarivorans sp. TSD2052]